MVCDRCGQKLQGRKNYVLRTPEDVKLHFCEGKSCIAGYFSNDLVAVMAKKTPAQGSGSSSTRNRKSISGSRR